MRGTRSLGLALIATALGAAPALAQQQNTTAPPPNAPAATAPAPNANAGDQSKQNQAATTPAANSNDQASSADKAANSAADQANNAKTEANNAQSSANNAKTEASKAESNASNAKAEANTANNNAAAAPAAAAPATNPPAASPPPSNTTTAANAKAPSGSLKKYNGDFRAGKLVGATVFDGQGDDIGSINDLLVDNNGKITNAIVSTGGGPFGIGSKLVSVPFDQLRFDESAGSGANAAPAAPANSVRGGAAAPVAGNTAANNNPTEYSVVLPNATKDSLSKQQEFKYASAD